MTQARVVRIHDTLSLERIAVSESYDENVRQRNDLEVIIEPEAMKFDASGLLSVMA